MKFAIGQKVKYAANFTGAISCEMNGRLMRGEGKVVGYERANGTMMYVVDLFGGNGTVNSDVRLLFESELKEAKAG